MRALISVYEKAGIETFAAGLAELGFELVSSGGTASFLEEQGLAVTRVEDVTGAPEMLGGRVKTLHPAIHAGILARLDLDEDRETLAEHGIEPFDVVCVNLYPFTSLAGPDRRRGGRHHRDDRRRRPVDAPRRGQELHARRPGLPPRAVRPRAGRAPRRRRSRRRPGARWPPRRSRSPPPTTPRSPAGSPRIEFFPDQLTLTFRKVTDLPYGENPHQTAAYYEEVGSRKHLLSRVNQLGGRELSYNNLADLEGARRVLREFDEPTVVIVKHANPCGVASAETIEHAYERALAADPVSAFGCVLMLNRPVERRARRR